MIRKIVVPDQTYEEPMKLKATFGVKNIDSAISILIADYKRLLKYGKVH